MTTLRGILLGLALALAASGAWADEACRVRAGADGLVIRALVLTGQARPVIADVAVDRDGAIACAGPDCHSARPHAARIECPGAVLSPGFINLHEHLAFAHIAPRPDDGVRYGQRNDWRKGMRGFKAREDFVLSTDPDVLAWGELRHLLSGTTSIVGGSMAPGLTRNLDLQAGLEGLNVARATYAIFPLGDADGTQREGDCDYPHVATEAEVGALSAYVAHVSEGRDGAARNEFRCLGEKDFDTTPTAAGGLSHDIVRANLVIVHGVGLTPAMLAQVGRRKSAVVWSPRSNLSLYGQTLDVAAARKAGVLLALGTDWLPSGSISMPREADCALAYSREHLGGLIGPRELWAMMTISPARAVHMEDAVGAIRTGLAADLILVRPALADPYEAVVRARPQDLLLVLRGGKALSGRAALMDGVAHGSAGCEPLAVNGAADTICVAAETGRSVKALAEKMAAQGVWPAFFPGAAPVEPACETRP